MSNNHKLDSVLDMLKLSPEQFARMLPDLVMWYEWCKSAEQIEGVTVTGFTWVDDGRPGEVHSVAATIVKDGEPTGEKQVFPGSAYEPEKAS